VEESAERPPMDLFKAIFENSASSSSSSSEATDDDEDTQQMDTESQKATIDNVRPDTVSVIAAAAVPEVAPVSVQFPLQQEDHQGKGYKSVGGVLNAHLLSLGY